MFSPTDQAGSPALFALCADDYGYRSGVSEAIRSLAVRGRISATSALVTFPEWARAAAAITDLVGHIDIGLHINLSEGAPLGDLPGFARDGSFPGIARLSALAVTGRLPLQAIRDEVHRQAEVFVAGSGRLPDFIDGHQHAHALPDICELTVELAQALRPSAPLPIRHPGDTIWRCLRRGVAPAKALAISALSYRLPGAAARRGVPTNRGFSGIYDFSADADLPSLFSGFLRQRGPRHLVMCHPGEASHDGAASSDPIAAARAREFEYLSGPDFAAILERTDVRLTRMTALLGN